MAPPPSAPRIRRGINPAYPAREELAPDEASKKLRDVVREFLEEAQAWGSSRRDEPPEDDGEET